jgi:1,4-dihydroxy-2-naphthoyl-CoA hydrolase
MTRDIRYENTIHEALAIREVELSPDRVVLEMDVGPRVHQPMGLLHGGASAVIAESAASIGGYLNCDPETQFTVGTDLNISHLRAKSTGTVTATATPIRRGRTMQVWAIDLVDEDGKPVAVARCTLAVRPMERDQV